MSSPNEGFGCLAKYSSTSGSRWRPRKPLDQAAREFLQRYADVFGAGNLADELVLRSDDADVAAPGVHRLRFAQRIPGSDVRVFGADTFVHFDADGSIRFVAVGLMPRAPELVVHRVAGGAGALAWRVLLVGSVRPRPTRSSRSRTATPCLRASLSISSPMSSPTPSSLARHTLATQAKREP